MKKLTVNEFIDKANKVHNNKYDYSKSVYVSSKAKVIITCPIHGDFSQVPFSHLLGKGCPKCGIESRANFQRKDISDFILEANKVHNNKYDYSKSVYVSSNLKLVITCPIHGDFSQAPSSHLSGRGCPKCIESKGEKYIRKFLEDNNVNFESQKRFKDCKYKRSLPFDFYLPDYNIFIEYNGGQHYTYTGHFHRSWEKFEEVRKKDRIKRKYARKNGTYIEISYKKNIEEEMKKLLDKIRFS